MQHTRKVLKNGLRLIISPMPSFESATVLVMVGAGSRYENRHNNGISHFLEHMAFKGTEKRPTAMDISSLVDGIGGEFNAFTGKETTGFYVKAGANNVELALDLLSDMLQNSKLDPTELNKERGVVIEEINMYEDTPMRKLGDIYETLLYGDTPMGWDIAGTKEVINSVTRQDFLEYISKLYSPDNMTVVVAGGVDSEKVEVMVEKYFGKMKRFDTMRAKKVIDGQGKPAVMVKKKKTEQVHIAIGVRTTPLEHPDRYGLDVLAAVLGGGMSSRLFHEVREKRGLAYYVRTSSDNYTDCGTLVTTAGIDPTRIEEAIKVILEQYVLIRQSGNITQEELTKAKEFLKGHFVLELEDSRSVASFYAHEELLESTLEDPMSVNQHIDEVTTDKLAEVAQKYIVEQTLNLAVIGNIPSGQKFESLLKLK
ncbi:MAG: insulinase family protein [Patescibacteria group bacterium]|nr:insulinase family protein [Patescibacteria group bacterium]MDE2588101.1 insulinase family protein [Patescibacteria group bacterium]